MSPFDSRSPGPGRMFPASAARTADTMPGSETAVRNLKASQSAKLAFAAAGIPNPSPALVNMVADYVRRKTLGIPPGQMAAMGPGSGELAANAVAGVNMAMGALSDEQRAAAREGNALSPDEIARMHAALNLPDLSLHPGHRANGQRNSGPASGARYDGVNGASFFPGNPAYWATPQGMNYMRSYAMQQGLDWAAGVPEILSMGPQAVKALADVHLKKESYDRLRTDASFEPNDVVTLAKLAKKEKVDANKLSNTINDFYRGLSPSEKNKLNKAIIPRMEQPDNERQKAKAAKTIDDMVRKHPHKRQKGDELKGTSNNWLRHDGVRVSFVRT